MMEEVNDDANVDSTFEFLGGRADDSTMKGLQSPGTKILAEDMGSAPSPASSVLNPIPSTASHLFTTAPSSGPGLFLQASSPRMSAPESAQSSIPSGVASVPMLNPNLPTMPPPPMSFPVSSMPQMYQPTQTASPYIPPGQGYILAPSGAASSGYTSPSSVTVPQTAYELPLDDSYSNIVSQQPNNNSSNQGVWSWIKGNEFLNKVAEKAKSSVDSVITTLDPGMKDIIYSGGDVNLVVASGSEAKVSAIREAFQQTFGKATIDNVPAQSSCIAQQPVGFSAAIKAAEERINTVRHSGLMSENQVLVAVENFLAELTPDKWFDIGCLLLQDPGRGITLQVYTQAIPVATHHVMQAKEQTPVDYPQAWSGFAVTIGEVLERALGVNHTDWHQAMTGTSRKDILFLAAKSLAGIYKERRSHS